MAVTLIKRGLVKGSSLHRSGLSKEKMTMLERALLMLNSQDSTPMPQFTPNVPQAQVSQGESQSSQAREVLSRKPQRQAVNVKMNELDLLYKNFHTNFKKPAMAIKKTPGFYFGLGFTLGAISMFIISFIVGVTSIPKKEEIIQVPVEVTATTTLPPAALKTTEPTLSQEKYTVKRGDTLDRIAYKFYGKYDAEKIEQIRKINNIKNVTSLYVGQVLVIPVYK